MSHATQIMMGRYRPGGAHYDMPYQRLHASVFEAVRFGVKGNNVDLDTIRLQEAVSEASAYVVAYATGAELRLPFGKFRVADTIAIQEHAVSVTGGGGANNLFTPYGTCLVPTEDFSNDQYVLSFDKGSKTTALYGNSLRRVAVMKQNGETLANTVHGIYWQVARGDQSYVYVDSMTGRSLGIQGVDADWKAHDSHFESCVYRRGGADGIEFLGSSADNWFRDCKIEGHTSGAGLKHPGAHNKFIGCHWTGNKNSVLFTAGSSECSFTDCTFETPREHNIDVDVTGGGVSNLRITGCQIDSNALTADATFDAIFIHRSSGSNKCVNTVIEGNTFASSETNKPRYHINLSGAAAEDIIIRDNTYSAITNKVNHNANSVRCIVDGLSRNNGVPGAAGNWQTEVRDGVRVLDTATGDRYEFSQLANAGAGAWIRYYDVP